MHTVRSLVLGFLLTAVCAAQAQAFTLLQPGVRGWVAGVVTWNYDLSLCVQPEDEILKAVDRAIAVWNSVPTAKLKMKRGGPVYGIKAAALMTNTASGDGVIACSNHFKADTGRDPDWTLAVGGAAVDDGGRIGFGYAILNADPEARFSTQDVTNDELSAVLAHELGHALGLGHSKDNTALMFMEAVSSPSLAQDDVDGITSLYRNPPTAEEYGLFGCATIGVVGGGGGGKGGPGLRALARTGSELTARDFRGIKELMLLFFLGYAFTVVSRKTRELVTGRVILA